MGQEERIQNAYRGLGGKRTFYDGMITCSTLSGRAVCRLVWGMGRAETQDYLSAALSGIPEGFSGRLLEVPVGTGILTMPLYREMPEAEITCLDYSPEMLERAKSRGEGLAHVRFQQGDVGALPFGNSSFDIVLSLNGGQGGRLAGDLSCTAARRSFLRLLLCAGTKPPLGLANPQAVCAKGLFHPAL